MSIYCLMKADTNDEWPSATHLAFEWNDYNINLIKELILESAMIDPRANHIAWQFEARGVKLEKREEDLFFLSADRLCRSIVLDVVHLRTEPGQTAISVAGINRNGLEYFSNWTDFGQILNAYEEFKKSIPTSETNNSDDLDDIPTMKLLYGK